MTPRSRLHVPAPPARPGQEPDFSYVQISPAGAVNRPDVTASVRDIENLSLEMVRVLESAPGSPRAVDGLAPHAAHTSVRRPHAEDPAAGAHLLLYQVHPRRGGGGGAGHGPAAGGHAVPLVSAAGPARSARPKPG